MEVKKIVEGMTAPQVAQIIDENFVGLNNEKADKKKIEENLSNLNQEVKKKPDLGNYTNADFSISDDKGNVLVEFGDGHVRTKNFDSNNLNQEVKKKPDLGNYANADFSISDDKGNVLVEFGDGHIRTKNFDSKELMNRSYVKLYESDFDNSEDWELNGVSVESNGSVVFNGYSDGYTNYVYGKRMYNLEDRWAEYDLEIGNDSVVRVGCSYPAIYSNQIYNGSKLHTGEGASGYEVNFEEKVVKIFKGIDNEELNYIGVYGYDSDIVYDTINIPNDFIIGNKYRVILRKMKDNTAIELVNLTSGKKLSKQIIGWQCGRQHQYYWIYCVSGQLAKLNNFRIFGISKPDVVIVGDSLTEGVCLNDLSKKWGNLLSEQNPTKIIVLSARGGSTSLDVLEKFRSEFNIMKPKSMILMIGTNDHKLANYESFYPQNLLEIKRKCDDIGCKLYVCHIPRNSTSEEMNALMEQTLLNNGYRFDVATSKNYDLDNTANSMAFAKDGVHLNELGNILMFERENIDEIIFNSLLN